MRKIFGWLLIAVGLVGGMSVIIGYIRWSMEVPARLLEPQILIGAAIILILVGIWLRGKDDNLY